MKNLALILIAASTLTACGAGGSSSGGSGVISGIKKDCAIQVENDIHSNPTEEKTKAFCSCIAINAEKLEGEELTLISEAFKAESIRAAFNGMNSSEENTFQHVVNPCIKTIMLKNQ